MSSRTVYWLVAHEKSSHAEMLLETYLVSVPIFSHSIVGISIRPDVCSFLGDPLHGSWWSLCLHFLIIFCWLGTGGDVLGQVAGARSEADGKRWSLSRALRQLAKGCAERVSDKQTKQVQGEEAALPPGNSQNCFGAVYFLF